jgi:hypothetical protein
MHLGTCRRCHHQEPQQEVQEHGWQLHAVGFVEGTSIPAKTGARGGIYWPKRAGWPLPPPTPWGDIAAGNGAIWLSVDGTPVTRIDPRTSTVSDQFVGGSGADAIRVGYGACGWLTTNTARSGASTLLGS